MSSKKKRKSLFSSAKKSSKRKHLSNSFDDDRRDALAATDQGSYFEQEKLIAPGEEEVDGRLLVLAGRKLKLFPY